MANDDANSQTAFDATHGGRPHRINTNPDTPDPSLRSGLDSFFKSMCGTYQTPTGNVVVPTPFMMNPGYDDQVTFKAVEANRVAMARLASIAGISQAALERVQAGRGSSDEIHALTQALIDQQPAPMALLNPAAAIWQPNDVRKLMHDHAIGIDCAGYVQQAYLRATGRTRAQMGFAPDIRNEALFGLPEKGFVKFQRGRGPSSGGHHCIQRAARFASAGPSNGRLRSARGDRRRHECDSRSEWWTDLCCGRPRASARDGLFVRVVWPFLGGRRPEINMDLQRDEQTVGASLPRRRVGPDERSSDMGGRQHRHPLRPLRRARRILSAKGALSAALVPLLVSMACGRSRDPGPRPAAQVAVGGPDASVDASAPGVLVAADSPLHVVVTHAVVREDAMMSPWLRVCPVRGAVLLCGEPAVYVERDGVMVRDATLEVGLAHDPTGPLTTLVDIAGRWPDNAWLISSDISQPPPFETTVYRRIGSRWRVAVQGHRSMNSFRIVPWGPNGALLVEETLSSRPNRATGLGAQTGRTIPDVLAVAPFNDTVLAVVRAPHGPTKMCSLQLWPASGAPLPPMPLLGGAQADPDVDVLGITPVRANEIVLYGYGGSDGAKEPYLARFDGKSLTPIIAPPAPDVISYVEESSGVAWALSSGKDAAWRRDVGGPWSAVALPLPYAPNSLTRTDDGAVWVLAFGPVSWVEGQRRKDINAALFSTHSPASILALGESSRNQRH